MSEELMLCTAEQAVAVTHGKNYIVTSPLTGNAVELKRGVDFAVVPGTKQPTLTKAGSERIVMAYNLMTRYSIESSIEQGGKDALFFYNVRCDLVKGFYNQQTGTYTEAVYTSGYGSANTSEKRNGMNDAFNAANSTLKMAQKRALSQAALSISGLSSMFTQDMENETFMKKANDIVAETPDSPISKAQITRLFAIAGEAGLTQQEAKQRVQAMGYASTKDIKVKDYEDVVKKLQEGN